MVNALIVYFVMLDPFHVLPRVMSTGLCALPMAARVTTAASETILAPVYRACACAAVRSVCADSCGDPPKLAAVIMAVPAMRDMAHGDLEHLRLPEAFKRLRGPTPLDAIGVRIMQRQPY